MRLPQDKTLYLYTNSYPAAGDLIATLASLAILVPVCLWVYRDARARYPGPAKPLLWALLVFMVLIVFLPLYLFLRPPKRMADGRPPTAP